MVSFSLVCRQGRRVALLRFRIRHGFCLRFLFDGFVPRRREYTTARADPGGRAHERISERSRPRRGSHRHDDREEKAHRAGRDLRAPQATIGWLRAFTFSSPARN